MDQNSESKLFADGDAYERYVGRWSRPIGAMFLDWLSLPSGLRWLDVGCGTGALSGMVLEHTDPADVTGIDPSVGFLSVAQAKVTDERAKFKIGDAQSLPVEDAKMDVSVSGLALNFIPDKKRAADEMLRAVKPGGVVALYVWDYAGEMQLMRYFWDTAVKLFPKASELDEGNLFPICNPEPLAELFQDAGLKEIETRAFDAPTVFADFDDYWSPFTLGQGPAGAFCVSLSENDRDRLREELENTIPFSDDGTIKLIARAWAVRGKR